VSGYDDLVALLEGLPAQLGTTLSENRDEFELTLPAENLHALAVELLESGFDRLDMVTAVDYPGRFELVYRMGSRSMSAVIFVKSSIGRDSAHIDSLVDVWPAANWQEREIFDLFGIDFVGHPDMRRILLPEEWPGWPLRKDYDDPNVIRRPDYI
jgi:NADH-quinone oxidoreductase subunit C